MGTSSSKVDNRNPDELKPKSISQIIDYIATYYILTMDFMSLRKLYEKEYCDNLVVLTSDIIERYFSSLEITYLAQRIKNGIEVNEIDKDNIIFFNKDELSQLDVQNPVKKKRICNGIAKFYIKIAHIFAAIVTTINPVYVYRDAEGNLQKATLYEKMTIPKNAPREILKLNFCQNRIDSLKRNMTEDPSSGNMIINPEICSVNVKDDGTLKNLEDEPGIPELEDLYFDDNYDINTGKFMGMTEQTKRMYYEDLKLFYKVFTDNSSIPDNIQKFSDIKLKDYSTNKVCQGSNPVLNQRISGNLSNKLFAQYADNLKNMIKKTNKNQEALLDVINKLFSYTINPQTNKRQIRVNPALNEKSLQEIINETRGLIIKLYLTCEADYTEGIKLYEAIVEQKILETSQNQIKSLEKLTENIIDQDNIPISAEMNAK